MDLHVQADPEMPLRESCAVSGRVKAAIRATVPAVFGTFSHMEPYEPPVTPPDAVRAVAEEDGGEPVRTPAARP